MSVLTLALYCCISVYSTYTEKMIDRFNLILPNIHKLRLRTLEVYSILPENIDELRLHILKVNSNQLKENVTRDNESEEEVGIFHFYESSLINTRPLSPKLGLSDLFVEPEEDSRNDEFWSITT